jgi:hypothetical protein
MKKLIDADPFSVFSPALEGYHPIYFGKDGKILSQTHIFTGMKLGPHLPDQDIPGLNLLAGISFDSKPLSFAITAVSGTATGFFMCHNKPL